MSVFRIMFGGSVISYSNLCTQLVQDPREREIAIGNLWRECKPAVSRVQSEV